MIGHPLSQVTLPFRVPTLHLLDHLQLLFNLIHLLPCQRLHRILKGNSAQVEPEFLVLLDVVSPRRRLALFFLESFFGYLLDVGVGLNLDESLHKLLILPVDLQRFHFP